ncbi:MAG TPA: type II toxin-antitoxin system RelE/ParE family toxin [Verrucomicrobiae bacterium]|nr:type II toxin-antitoxin system RelE/ParE family toxin [Verrucomicrobiae bacterium]
MILDFTAAAVADLQSIAEYTRDNWGAQQEKIYLESLWAKFEEILADPGKWRARPDLFAGCQIAAQSRHVILFRVQGSTLQIVRILHSSMDFRRHVRDLK